MGPEPRMQLYDRGIRRRLAPMLGGDQRKLHMALSLMFTLPGTPVVWYGDEIGMGDDLSLPERNSVRTPMQWTPGRNGGFSLAPTRDLIRPVIARGPFSCERVNVHLQQRDPASLLNCMEKLIRTRKGHNEFGWGTWRLVDTREPSVFAIRSEFEGECMVAMHNLAGRPCTTALDLDEDEVCQLVDVLGDQDYPPPRDGRFELGPYGYRWFRRGELGP
jgi:maltose alpha-D-glucosyltransferase/alpha-amylase